MEKPPTILFRHQLGPIAQSNEGKLIVYPGTILHLECLWIRKYGIPHWQVSHSYRKYPEGKLNISDIHLFIALIYQRNFLILNIEFSFE